MDRQAIAALREILDLIATDSVDTKADVRRFVPTVENLKKYFEILATKKHIRGALGRLFKERVHSIISSFQEERIQLRERLASLKEMHEFLGKLSIKEVEAQVVQALLTEVHDQYQCLESYCAMLDQKLEWFQLHQWPWA